MLRVSPGRFGRICLSCQVLQGLADCHVRIPDMIDQGYRYDMIDRNKYDMTGIDICHVRMYLCVMSGRHGAASRETGSGAKSNLIRRGIS